MTESTSEPTTTLEAQAAKSSPVKQLESSPAKAAAVQEESAAAATTATTATFESSAATEEQLDAVVRISKDSNVRKLISFVMSRLDRGGTVTLQALNQCVHKAITVALISRDRLGNIFQVNSLLVVQEGGVSASAAAASASSAAGDGGADAVDDSKIGGDE